uniref:Transmembrane protein n=1 Tax=Noctiluca scintillans TaxID=2966 RepID=A0A7S1AY23_NOCSC|mmetsp:Transcript_64223/g.170133  ORF Transcript_64223/g.170133 Transcript_64223/m.170133 type:complete len:210 (+) Transcript_64223:67-696(+)
MDRSAHVLLAVGLVSVTLCMQGCTSTSATDSVIESMCKLVVDEGVEEVQVEATLALAKTCSSLATEAETTCLETGNALITGNATELKTTWKATCADFFESIDWTDVTTSVQSWWSSNGDSVKAEAKSEFNAALSHVASSHGTTASTMYDTRVAEETKVQLRGRSSVSLNLPSFAVGAVSMALIGGVASLFVRRWSTTGATEPGLMDEVE